ncbi:MAG: type II toxin-antitoxin system RelE/ParE family toxin [Rhodothermaceae bacterium]|nr:type II toxin-antitoxin system RelE/ParE family toxin [Rhodothermaceae bacterium]
MTFDTLILFIKHKGLRAYWGKGIVHKLSPHWMPRVERIMNALDIAKRPEDLHFPGWRLHLLKGKFEGYYSVRVTGNWRIVFRFAGTDVTDVDLIDYH